MASPPRVCFCTHNFATYKVGGAEVQLYLLGKKLSQKGWGIHFTTTDVGQPSVQDVDGLHVHKTYPASRTGNPFWLVPNSLQFLSALSQADADIYHQRGAGDSTGYISLFCKLKQKKFVFTAAHIDNCNLRWVERSRFTRTPLYLYGLHHADRVTVLAEYMRNEMRKNLGIDPIVIRSGHPVPTVVPSKSREPRFLWVGRFETWKQPELYVKLAQRFPEVSFEMVGKAGLSGKAYSDSILAQIRKTPNIEYHESIPFDRISEHFGHVWAFVNTSVSEGFPNTYIQAWMVKTPVLALHVDPDNAIVENRLGFVSGSFDRLCQDAKSLISSRSSVSSMGNRCRTYAKREHDISKIARQYFELYEGILQR